MFAVQANIFWKVCALILGKLRAQRIQIYPPTPEQHFLVRNLRLLQKAYFDFWSAEVKCPSVLKSHTQEQFIGGLCFKGVISPAVT